MWTLLAALGCLSLVAGQDKACPYKPVDIIFVLDGSGSEGLSNFNKQLSFAAEFTRQFEIGPSNTQVALLSFGTSVHNEFNLDQYTDNATVIQNIMSATYPNGETNTHMALRYVASHTLSAQHGGDRNVTKFVIVLTDGRSLEPTLTQSAAETLKKNPLVTIVAIGIGSGVDSKELSSIASDSNHTFRVADFDALETLQPELTFTTCKACNDISDICFVLDSSGSEGAVNFQKQLEFVNMIVNEFSYDGTDHTQVCIITFSTSSHTEIRLETYRSAESLIENVLKIPYRDGETRTDLGMTSALSELNNRHDGARRYANKVMIVLTDGRSTEPQYTKKVSTNVHRNGVETFAIGIGSSVDESELRFIASDNDHMWRVHDFDELESIHQHVVDSICVKSLLRTTTTTTTTTTTATTTVTTTTLPPTTTKAACGLKPADIVFVLDSSDSEGPENFQTEVDFVYNFAAQFSIGTNNVQFSVVTFSSDVRNNFFFSDYSSRRDVLNAIRNNVTYIGQGTNTSAALEFVRTNSLLPANGARNNSAKFVIVITDGRSDEPISTEREAKLLHSMANVISIGVGPSVDRSELETIASNHRFLTVENFALLKTIRKQLTDLACAEGA